MVDLSRVLREGLRAYRAYRRVAGRLRAPSTPPPTTPRSASRPPAGSPRARAGSGTPARSSAGAETPAWAEHYPGDWRGPVDPVWDPHPDGRPDPGEIVWTWVPYQEDPRRGKDRPVLIIGRQGESLLCLMLTSRAHDTADHDDPNYVAIGTGSWDSRGRASQVRVDRVIPVPEDAVRREGAVLSRERFAEVVRALRAVRG